MNFRFIHPALTFLSLVFCLAAQTQAQSEKPSLPEAKRILFLGDSITHSGQYIEFLETILLFETDKRYEILDLGLSSETVSGLSEPGHADGKFPRPDLHERLDRVLAKTKPNLIFACYGMNDGIYFPYRDTRFQKYVEGIEKLRTKAKAAGAPIIHLTPPVFDPFPIKDKVLPPGLKAYPKPFTGYNQVLDRYSEWLISKRPDGWQVIDIHGPMSIALAEGRQADPNFAFAKDGVHPNDQGHWIMTQAILKAWGIESPITLEDLTAANGKLNALHKLVAERQRVLKAAWLSACGHKRPGVKEGLPLPEAEAKAATLSTQIITALAAAKNPTQAEEVRPAVPASAEKGPMPKDPDKSKAPTTPPPKPATDPKPADGKSSTPPASPTTTKSGSGLFPGTVTNWHGFEKYELPWEQYTATIVAPKSPASGRPWVWHGEFFGHKPDPDVALLGKGYHIVYLKVSDTLGAPSTVKTWTDFYNHLTKTYRFSKKPALVGLSRGGLYCYNWAIANPEKVSCIYADAPVCDFKSWPGGKGKGKGDPTNWQRVLTLWNFKDEAEALAYTKNPVDAIAPLAKHKVPLLHVFGDADDVVIPAENTLLLAERYRALGGPIELIAKSGVGHHPHGLQDSSPIINFIARNTH